MAEKKILNILHNIDINIQFILTQNIRSNRTYNIDLNYAAKRLTFDKCHLQV